MLPNDHFWVILIDPDNLSNTTGLHNIRLVIRFRLWTMLQLTPVGSRGECLLPAYSLRLVELVDGFMLEVVGLFDIFECVKENDISRDGWIAHESCLFFCIFDCPLGGRSSYFFSRWAIWLGSCLVSNKFEAASNIVARLRSSTIFVALFVMADGFRSEAFLSFFSAAFVFKALNAACWATSWARDKQNTKSVGYMLRPLFNSFIVSLHCGVSRRLESSHESCRTAIDPHYVTYARNECWCKRTMNELNKGRDT